jgi:hypothetical protein
MNAIIAGRVLRMHDARRARRAGAWAPGPAEEGTDDADGVEGLVRPVLKRPHPWLARSIPSTSAASGWGTPDPATPLQAVTGSGVDALRYELVDRRGRRP